MKQLKKIRALLMPYYFCSKAYAEWVLFSSSGISSALYHACDVDTWCVLSFHVLQVCVLHRLLARQFLWRKNNTVCSRGRTINNKLWHGSLMEDAKAKTVHDAKLSFLGLLVAKLVRQWLSFWPNHCFLHTLLFLIGKLNLYGLLILLKFLIR